MELDRKIFAGESGATIFQVEEDLKDFSKKVCNSPSNVIYTSAHSITNFEYWARGIIVWA